MLTTLFLFLGAFAVAMVLHELAHALAARMFGVWVQRVTIFWDLGGVQLALWHMGKTTCVIGWFPFISMVELAGQAREDLGGNDPIEGRDYEVQAKAPWQRILIYLSGGVVNLLIAALLVLYGGMTWSEPFVYINLWFAGMNLGPIGRTDGGRAFDLAMKTWPVRGHQRAYRLMLFVVLAVVIWLMGGMPWLG